MHYGVFDIAEEHFCFEQYLLQQLAFLFLQYFHYKRYGRDGTFVFWSPTEQDRQTNLLKTL